jgi:Rod binding domain-containing protein
MMNNLSFPTPLSPAVQAAKQPVSQDRVRQTAEDFASVFYQEMLKPMFSGLSTNGLGGGGQAEEIYRGQMLQEYGKMMSKSASSAPLIDALTHKILQMQEKSDG